MNVTLGGVLKEVRTRAQNAGLGCSFEKGLKVPYASVSADGKFTQIVVPMPDPLWKQKQWDLWWYMLEHELGHIVPAMLDAYDVLKRILMVSHSLGMDLTYWKITGRSTLRRTGTWVGSND